MRSWRFFAGALCGVLAVLVLAGGAQAVRIDKAGTLEFRAKLQTRLTTKLQKSDGWTFPDVAVGNLVQWRNLANLKVEHDLRKLTKELDLMAPFKWAGIRSPSSFRICSKERQGGSRQTVSTNKPTPEG